MTYSTDHTQYPIVHPSDFSNNPLVAYIGKEPYWTVSDDQKRPVNALALLQDNEVKNIRFDGEHQMVTLAELDANPDLQAVNRAYRLRARENRVIAIDVEPIAPDDMKQQVLHFPAHFTEFSRNGGVHLFIKVPEDLITDENRYMFDDLSVFKEPVPKDTDGKDLRKAHFEVIFNDHFITFTKKMVVQKPCVDYTQDAAAKEQLRAFLAQITEMDKTRREQREKMKAYRIQVFEDSISDEKEELIEKFMELEPFAVAREQAEEKTAADFAGDLSRYEIAVASGIASHTIRIHNLSKGTISFKDIANKLNEQDLVYIVYLMLQDVVPHREKHDEERDGLPWLLYTSKRAYEYVRANGDKKKK